ncbi:MAG TPA: flagellar basal body L-ring protein FlgH [Geminicoccaceae bacterium]|nr:flagellar basal body L-ring protein FlgH [Geminicoccaceae bacterium]
MRALVLCVLPLLAMVLGGCANTIERLSRVGQAPELSPIENPVQQAGYRPVSLPMPVVEPEVYPANSLWRQGARSFFKDQRARTVGDVLTVEVTIADEATLRNETRRTRENEDSLSASNFFGLETKLSKIFPEAVDPSNLVDLQSELEHGGRGNTARTEEIRVNIAAVVIQVLPNGNLVIQGRQEVRVNFEVRELFVAGVVRREDITPANTIKHDQIAELRVAYGGRGQITDVQQPRYGAQVLDIILPY